MPVSPSSNVDADIPGSGLPSPPFFDASLPSSSLDGLSKCERHGCRRVAIDVNDEGEELCLDHLSEWAIGEDDGFGEFDE
jgi:hypothetical protein